MNRTLLSIILPAYNEVKNIEKVVGSVIEFVPGICENYEVIIVDDGSRDGTGRLVDKLAQKYDQVVAIHHLFNRGYGATLRTGFEAARGDLIFFTDADGQFDIKELTRLTEMIKEGADIACGYRMKRADRWMRKVNAGIYNLLVRFLFGIKVKDIDCAFKLFKRKVIDNIKLTSDGAFINAEFLILASKKGYVIKQIGVSHFPRREGKQTGNNIAVVLRAFLELFRFWRKIRKTKI